MEANIIPTDVHTPKSPTSSRRKWILASIGFIVLVVILVPVFVVELRKRKTGNPNYTGSVVWRSCSSYYNGQLCGFLEVPMDYTKPNGTDRVTLALRKIPATAPSSEFLGTIMINPGGPGVSGTKSLIKHGAELASSTDNRYDILAFDPRGTGLTEPALNFATCRSPIKEIQAQMEQYAVNSTTRVLTKAESYEYEARIQNVSLYCQDPVNPLYLQSLGTAFVARDMREIMLAIGETSVNFWGYSYGTVIGSVFAAMFPNLAHRMVLDGVVDSPLWFNNRAQHMVEAYEDSDKVLAEFVSECVSSTSCAAKFSQSSEPTTIASLSTRLSNMLKGSNATVTNETSNGAVSAPFIDRFVSQFFVLKMLYWPKEWPMRARQLSNMEKFGSSEVTQALKGRVMEHLDAALPFIGIQCSEANLDYYEESSSSNISSLVFHPSANDTSVAEMGQVLGNQCKTWPWRAKEVYRGPWTVAAGLRKTAFPIMFIGNIDPVTPLRSAKNMALAFGSESATLLIQNSFGHTSSAQVSSCTTEKIRNYFVKGVVPTYGTTCETDATMGLKNTEHSAVDTDTELPVIDMMMMI